MARAVGRYSELSIPVISRSGRCGGLDHENQYTGYSMMGDSDIFGLLVHRAYSLECMRTTFTFVQMEIRQQVHHCFY
jgi:hypothetical protein